MENSISPSVSQLGGIDFKESNRSVHPPMDELSTPLVPFSLTSPNGGESWAHSTQHPITWTNGGTATIDIDYSYNNGSTWVAIVSNLASNVLSFLWTVQNHPSTNCLIRIKDHSNPSISDVSDNVFTIT